MEQADNWQRRSTISLSRLLPRLSERFADRVEPEAWQEYIKRIKTHFPRLFRLLYQLYGNQYDFFYHLENILAIATKMWLARSADLKALDVMRQADPHWYQSHRMVGAMCYVDLFAGDLPGLRDRVFYLKELGITYLHLMPLFKTPAGDNDGGYAISSYREVNPALGTIALTNMNGRNEHYQATSIIKNTIACIQTANSPMPLKKPLIPCFPTNIQAALLTAIKFVAGFGLPSVTINGI